MNADAAESQNGIGPAPPPREITQPTLLTPVAAAERIAALDVLRGFALLGILMVNMVVFAMPLASLMAPDLTSMPIGERLAWALMTVLVQYKFVSLFSLLFGAGLIVQMIRAQQRGRPFVPVYLRRLLVLALIGAAHGILLWYGDILFIYAFLGLWLLLFRWMSARAMLWFAAVILAVLVLFQAGVGVLVYAFGDAIEASMSGGHSRPRAVTPPGELTATAPDQPSDSNGSSGTIPPDSDQPAPREETSAAEPGSTSLSTQPATPAGQSFAERHPRWARALPWLVPMVDSGFDISNPIWIDAETRAYRDGPFFDAQAFRTITWVFGVLAACFGFGWHALAMFFIGAAMMKLRFFSPDCRRWHSRLFWLGMPMGLALEMGAAWMTYDGLHRDDIALTLFGAAIHEVGSAIMCLGLVGLVCVMVWHEVLWSANRMIGYAGRMALTNYLMQTVIATSLTYWWGLGWFGEVSRVEQIGLAIAIWSGQVIASTMWFQMFAMGPAEWLWRSLTYLQIQPLMKQAGPPTLAPG